MIVSRSSNLVLDRNQSNDEYHVFLVSDESIDSHGTVFRLEGWEFSQYINNPVVTYGHPGIDSTDDTDIIGRSELFRRDGKIYAKLYYDMESEKAVRIKSKVERGFLNMCSIRASVKDGDWGDAERGEDENVLYFKRQELIDWGIVMHGSNRNAQAQRSEDIARALNIERDSENPKKVENKGNDIHKELLELAKNILS
jgi:hypothetical protein